MKTIVITKENFFQGEIEALIALFKEQLVALHLRKPNASKEELRAFIEKIPSQYHCKIVLHQHHELLEEFDLKRIHLKDGQWKDYNYKSNIQYSASTHQLEDLKHLPQALSYVFLSPIFDSISKQDYPAAFERNELIAGLLVKDIEVFALGGINNKNVEEVKSLGFNGIACLGYIWGTYENDLDLIRLVDRFKAVEFSEAIA